MPPLRMHRDQHLFRQRPLPGQVRQMGRAVHPDIKPGLHPVPDAGAGMVPFSAGIGDVKHPGGVHVKTGFADNAKVPEITGPRHPGIMLQVCRFSGHGRY